METFHEFVKSLPKLGVKQYTWVYSKFWTGFCKFWKCFQLNHVVGDSNVGIGLCATVFVKILKKKSKVSGILEISFQW